MTCNANMMFVDWQGCLIKSLPNRSNMVPAQRIVRHPVIIAGAGPCGLVAALTLKQRNVPFVILEKAARDKLCSNVGSGFDIAKTTTIILGHRLDLPIDDILLDYGGLYISTLEGKRVRDSPVDVPQRKKMKDLEEDFRMASANRADMQTLLLDSIFPKSEDEEGVLKCGASVESYKEDECNGQVVVTLSDRSTLIGCALLACDGIHSKIRACMHGGRDDPLHYCKANCYWGKTSVVKGSNLERELLKTQTCHKTGSVSVVIGTGTVRKPGSFFLAPSKGQVLWGIFEHSKEPPRATNDLTRRGGGILTEHEKKDLIAKFGTDGNFALMEAVLEHTPADAITLAGLFDRKNLDLPYSSPGKLVALLGDAAHPQTPFLGQGVNMAITDAYVYATRIADAVNTSGGAKIAFAIDTSDTKLRRDQAKKMIKEARRRCDGCVSSGRFDCWILRTIFKHMPMSWLIQDSETGDKSNKEMLESLQATDDDLIKVIEKIADGVDFISNCL
jgi:2-polyprenyl-6-methoxyphenol hydroxylase-like FAD-dependent oxidoreductase